MYRIRAFLWESVNRLIECEQKRKFVLDSMETNDFDVYDMFFCLVLKVHMRHSQAF